ncbi:hypothetical protein FYK55_03040 [Roseiconus nitratireducens]|uniref:Leucine Rich repeats (2 copies) n=1 Tax=Roseiconus nitratireducens TaxID=2605748 RepID=A0A5M6DKP4_9BACT|nr:hypothetical protein [Roseiconus nitratireducens]KAA5545905.1 hypothetical protein FYK55_03040 [Roseiconus nitratireducens]
MSNKRGWLRVSLRMLLIAFTAVAIGIAWFANYAQKRWAAFEAVREAGGEIQMGIGEPTVFEKWFGPELFGVVNKIDLRKGTVDNELLKQIGHLSEVRRLDLSNAKIDDDGLQWIVHLPLRELWLQSTQISDASAESISQMRSLDFLQLNATSVSDTFLEALRPLPELEDLGLRGTEVTGVGMKSLARHPRLKSLDVYHTDVDDSGVESLVQCQSLTDLGLSMTQVTDAVFEHLDKMPKLTEADLSANGPVTTEAVLAFEKSHPSCDIEWYRK